MLLTRHFGIQVEALILNNNREDCVVAISQLSEALSPRLQILAGTLGGSAPHIPAHQPPSSGSSLCETILCVRSMGLNSTLPALLCQLCLKVRVNLAGFSFSIPPTPWLEVASDLW